MIWKNPFLLAPLAGYTDEIFRRLCHEKGAGLSFTEMVSAKGLYYKNQNTEDLLEIAEKLEGPTGIQLFGHEPEMFEYAAVNLKDRPNVCIDINMGCPVPKVVKNFEGSALLNKPDLAAECIRACAKGGKPVSVKMRIGFSEKKGYVEFAEKIADAGASFITVHGRTREQYYSGKADWDAIKEIKEHVAIPVVGNGDVFSGEDAMRMLDYTGCDAVMIARGALGNPWIFEQCNAILDGRQFYAPELNEIKDAIARHAELLVNKKGEYIGIRQMRSHAGFYIKGIKGAGQIRARINTAETLEQLLSVIKEI